MHVNTTHTFSLLSTNASIVHSFKITSALTISEKDFVSVAKRLLLNWSLCTWCFCCWSPLGFVSVVSFPITRQRSLSEIRKFVLTFKKLWSLVRSMFRFVYLVSFCTIKHNTVQFSHCFNFLDVGGRWLRTYFLSNQIFSGLGSV